MQILTENAAKYTVKQLFLIAGLRQNIEQINIIYGADECRINVPLSGNNEIIFSLMKGSDTEQLLKGEIGFKTIPSFDKKVNIPIFYANGIFEGLTNLSVTVMIVSNCR